MIWQAVLYGSALAVWAWFRLVVRVASWLGYGVGRRLLSLVLWVVALGAAVGVGLLLVQVAGADSEVTEVLPAALWDKLEGSGGLVVRQGSPEAAGLTYGYWAIELMDSERSRWSGRQVVPKDMLGTSISLPVYYVASGATGNVRFQATARVTAAGGNPGVGKTVFGFTSTVPAVAGTLGVVSLGMGLGSECLGCVVDLVVGRDGASAYDSAAGSVYLVGAGFGYTSDVEIEAGGGGGGHVISNEGTPLAAEDVLNFVGAGVVASEGAGETVVTVADQGEGKMTEEQGATLLGYVGEVEVMVWIVTGVAIAGFVAMLLAMLRR